MKKKKLQFFNVIYIAIKYILFKEITLKKELVQISRRANKVY